MCMLRADVSSCYSIGHGSRSTGPIHRRLAPNRWLTHWGAGVRTTGKLSPMYAIRLPENGIVSARLMPPLTDCRVLSIARVVSDSDSLPRGNPFHESLPRSPTPTGPAAAVPAVLAHHSRVFLHPTFLFYRVSFVRHANVVMPLVRAGGAAVDVAPGFGLCRHSSNERHSNYSVTMDVHKPRVHGPRVSFARRIARQFTLLVLVFVVVVSVAGCTTSLRNWVRNGFKVGPNYRRPPAPVSAALGGRRRSQGAK